MGRDSTHLTPILKCGRKSRIQGSDVTNADVQRIVVGIDTVHRGVEKHLLCSGRIISDDDFPAAAPIRVMGVFSTPLMLTDRTGLNHDGTWTIGCRVIKVEGVIRFTHPMDIDIGVWVIRPIDIDEDGTIAR